ncbi:MAG: hypothetical protein QOH62_505 [Solirubrobacteraceae bacterium]|jgi:hypothetical protein|nr:hypothetical protein [Solirubrobacteraceae bacterium]
MWFEARSSTEIETGPSGRVVRVGGRARAEANVEVAPPLLLAGGHRIAAHELLPLRLGPAWTPFALTYAVPVDVPREGWLLEVPPPPDPSLAAAFHALEAIEAVHARIDSLEAKLARVQRSDAPSASLLELY